MRKRNTVFIKQLCLLLGLCWYTNAWSQSDMTLYQMNRLPQAQLLNPAFPQAGKMYFSLPFLSGINVGWSNHELPIRHLGVRGMGLRLDNGHPYSDLIGSSPTTNTLLARFQTDLLHLGFKTSYGSWSIAISEHVQFASRMPTDLFRLLADSDSGLSQAGTLYDLQQLDAQLLHYRSFSVAFAKNLNQRLRLGVRLKYLWGYSHLNTENDGLQVNGTGEPDQWNLQGQLQYRSSGLYRMAAFQDDAFVYFSNPGNAGWAVDLGFHYKMGPKWNWYGSILNLGAINWKNQTRASQTPDMIANPLQYFQGERSALSDRDGAEAGAYQTQLPTQLFLGGRYLLRPDMHFGLVYQQTYFDGINTWGASLSFHRQLYEWLNFSVNYNAFNKQWFQLGTGVSCNVGALQVFAISDNLLSLLPQNKSMHWQAGLNYTFGRAFDYVVQEEETETQTDFWNRPAYSVPTSQHTSNLAKASWETTSETNNSPYFLLIGETRSRTDGSPLEQINMDVFELLPNGQRELVRTGRFPDGKFKLNLKAGKTYELVIDKGGFETAKFGIAVKEPNSMARLFFLREIPKDAPLYAYNEQGRKERLINERSKSISDMTARPQEEEETKQFVLTARTSLRESATHESDVLTRFGPSEKVELLERTNKSWWKVRYQRQTGWVKAKLLKATD